MTVFIILPWGVGCKNLYGLSGYDRIFAFIMVGFSCINGKGDDYK
jgi:hypothetical protein